MSVCLSFVLIGSFIFQNSCFLFISLNSMNTASIPTTPKAHDWFSTLYMYLARPDPLQGRLHSLLMVPLEECWDNRKNLQCFSTCIYQQWKVQQFRMKRNNSISILVATGFYLTFCMYSLTVFLLNPSLHWPSHPIGS